MTKHEIQKALAELGYYKGAIDGIIGPISRGAISGFQRDHGLSVDGIAGPITQAALRKATGGEDEARDLPKLDARSERNLKGVHPDLVRVMRIAIDRHPVRATITEGLRTISRQRHLVSIGASKTLNSRHLTGHAVDVVFIIDRRARWDWPLYKSFANTVKTVAKEESVPIVWGGDWKSFVDGPHFELDRRKYR